MSEESEGNKIDSSAPIELNKSSDMNDTEINMSEDRKQETNQHSSDDTTATRPKSGGSATSERSEENKTPQLDTIDQPKHSTKDSETAGQGFFSLTKRKKTPPLPKIQSSGIVNYGVGQNSDSESDASSVSVNSVSHGYDLPMVMQTGYRHSQFVQPDGEDDASVRTPIPTGPPEPGALLPSAFLRNRNNSVSNVSDISEEESSIVKRKKREAENVGRLVVAAKQQQSFAQAWFSAGKSENANALPKYVPPKKNMPSQAKPLKKKTSFKDPERSTGPIDLDSGDVWDGEAEQGSKSNWEVGSFNFTTHSGTTKPRRNQGFITFGVPDDEDLTTYYTETKCCDRIVCSIGTSKISLLALIIVVTFILASIILGIYFGVVENQKNSIVFSPPQDIIDMPSNQPSSSKPSDQPSTSPSKQPSNKPSLSPSFAPSLKPSVSPTTTQKPSMAPSSSPSTYFSSREFSQVGEDLKLGGETLDEFGSTISISENGDIVAVGATYGPNTRGSITIYRLKTNSGAKEWEQMGAAIEGLVENSFAAPSVDLSSNGQALITGEQNGGGSYYSGTARIFSFNDSTQTWDQIGDTIQQNEENDNFGHAVAISDLVVGAGLIVAISSPKYIFEGKVTTYELNEEEEWIELATAYPDPQFSILGFDIEFGRSISLSSNGTILACGAPGGATRIDEPAYSFINHGYVQILELDRSAFPEWIPREPLIPYEGELWDDFQNTAEFGISVSLSADGTRVAIGSSDDLIESHPYSGSVSVYEFNGASYEIIGDPIIGNPSASQKFGQSVALSSDGAYLTVGAMTNTFEGRVFIYQNSGALWDAAQVIAGNADEYLGTDVAIAIEKGDEIDIVTIAAGGPYFGPSIDGRGVARIFEADINR